MCGDDDNDDDDVPTTLWDNDDADIVVLVECARDARAGCDAVAVVGAVGLLCAPLAQFTRVLRIAAGVYMFTSSCQGVVVCRLGFEVGRRKEKEVFERLTPELAGRRYSLGIIK